ncbi:MAG: cell division protein FtsZ, partial [Candidatus Thermochlorobacter sp.]
GDIKIRDAQEAMNYIYEQAGSDATIIHGVVEDDAVPGEINVTVIATGFNKKKPSTAAEQLRVVRREDLAKSVNPNVENKLSRMNAEMYERPEKRDDTPTFIRLGMTSPEPLENAKPNEAESHTEKPNLTPEQDRIRKTNSDTPAFLRKIMD